MLPPAFAVPERRSYAVPIAVAIALLLAGVLAIRLLSPATPFECTILKTEILPETSVFKSDSIVVAPPHTEYTLLVVVTVRAENKRLTATTLDDFSLTLTDANGGQMTVKALHRQEIADVEVEFPKLKPLDVSPLLRDTAIAPGRSAEGTLVFSLPLPESIWTNRKSANIEVTPYHLDPIPLTIPK